VAGRGGLTHARAHLVLLSVVVLWAGAFAAIKQLLDAGLSSPQIAGVRFLMAAPGFAYLLYRAGGLPAISRGDLARVAVAGLCWVAVYHLALNQGELHTTAGTSAVIVGTAPGMTLGLAVLLGLERFSGWRLAGLAIAFGGVVVAVTLGSGQGLSVGNLAGPLLVLVAAASFAVYNVIVKPLMARAGTIAISSAASLIGMLPLLPLLGTSGGAGLGSISAGSWLLLAYLGLACTLFAYVAWTMALGHVDASRAVAYLYGVPPLAVLIGAATLSEHVTIWLVLGAGLVVGGVAVAQVQR
jgi:drug/metabolite transporter (DMT)-like permease